MVDLEGRLTLNDRGRPIAHVRNAQTNDIDTELTVKLDGTAVFVSRPLDDPDADAEGYDKYDLEPGDRVEIPLPMKRVKDGAYDFYGESTGLPFYTATVEGGEIVNEGGDVISEEAMTEKVRPGGPPHPTALAAEARQLEKRINDLQRERTELKSRVEEEKQERREYQEEIEVLRDRVREEEQSNQVDSFGKLGTEAIQLVIGRQWWRDLLGIFIGGGR